MLTKDQAAAVAIRHEARRAGLYTQSDIDRHAMVLDESATQETSFGWLFHFVLRDAPEEELYGAGPLAVCAADGDTELCASWEHYDEFIARCERRWTSKLPRR
jgi:hypothetical protein